jgi:hypothetical protein
MKPRERGGVVDSQLNLYGVTGLKVAGSYHFFPHLFCLQFRLYSVLFSDLSIAPAITFNVSLLALASTSLSDDYPSLEHLRHHSRDCRKGSPHYRQGARDQRGLSCNKCTFNNESSSCILYSYVSIDVF